MKEEVTLFDWGLGVTLLGNILWIIVVVWKSN